MVSRTVKFGLVVIFVLLGSLQVSIATGPERVRMLFNTLEKDPDFKVRIAAAQALAKIADGSVADWMLRAFRGEKNSAVRLTILYAIAEIPDERVLSPLIELAHQEILSSRERVLVEKILWNFRAAFHKTTWIAQAMNPVDREVQLVAIWLLGIIGDKQLVPVYEKLLDDLSEDVQIKSLESLSKVGDPSALKICKQKTTELELPRLQRTARYCAQLNEVMVKNKMPPSFQKKMDMIQHSFREKSIRPAQYLAYLDKNVNQRSLDIALPFLQPLKKGSRNENTMKLIEQEKMATFELEVNLVSKYEFDTRDLEILKTIVRENSSSLDICYTKELRQYPKLQGEVKTYFKILRSGRLSDVAITNSTLKNQNAETCILKELQRFQFPSLPVDSVTLIYTFSFFPPKETKVIFR